ncbi:hypothetical protein FQR65_LT01135 [Abscondita terminalis]|nr:hypothetical protein FQR65_LT01135 [Abscondita terminalis]
MIYVVYLFITYFLVIAQSDQSKNANILVYENVWEQPNKYYFREDHFVVRGVYTYTGPDNVLYARNYIADDKGYREEVLDENVLPEVRLDDRIGTAAIITLQGGYG